MALQRRGVMFIGRESEVERLSGFYEGDKCAVAVVSGQIGIGKTTLLQEFAQDKKGLFFEAYETTGKHQMERLSSYMGSKKTFDPAGFCKEISKRAGSIDSSAEIIMAEMDDISECDEDIKD